ncbi:MAG: tRNA pseudouridine(38-40) synthase TruA [Planctomycetes bacterium]|nr:tRNA pseudouridine(38-40) synthase TruA [Planctomycetota bacterium]
MTARNYKLVLAYDGADFHGWQTQPGLRTVQEEVRQTVLRVVRAPTELIGASRTDAGVHAMGQTASFRTEAPIPLEGLRRAISHHLPDDVALVSLIEAPEAFHATRDARGKLYRYHIHAHETRPVAALRQRNAWHVWYPLDLDRMRDAAARLIGKHDFAGFATAGSQRPTTVRSIFRVDVRAVFAELLIDVEGDGFLYNQVRNMVGTLVEIGRGLWPPTRIDEILASCDRRLAGPTAPAHGLCLQWVRYDPMWRPPDATVG